MSVESHGRSIQVPVIKWVVRWAVWGLLLSSCMSAVAADRLVVYAVNYPLAYFAERIGGVHVEVHFPAPAGIDPAFWMPDAETVAGYQGADLVLLNGAGYAKWVERVSLPRRKLVDTSQSFSGSYIQVTVGVKHQHGPDGDHAHAGIAFTTWLDFNQAAEQAGQVATAMSRRRPEHAAVFDENLQRLQEELLQLDSRMQALAAAQPGLPLLASHPVYQYLARRYGLQLRSVTWEPDVQPDGSSWRDLQSMLETQASHWMLWEDNPHMETRKGLERLGVQTVLFRPAMNRPARGDFMTVMQANIEALAVAFDAPD